MLNHLLGRILAVVVAMLLAAPVSATIWESVPDEQLTALELKRDASPKELYDALSARYLAELNKGKLAQWWEPIPMDQYLAPTLFYTPPNIDMEVSRSQCVDCHKAVTHGWVKSWEKSVHANLDEIRNLDENDVRAYKKGIIAEVEGNLRSLNLLAEGKQLGNVGCIDCHMGVGMEKGNHKDDLRLPDRTACGSCHLRQFAEAESERDTLVWPQDQWAPGHPSHTVDYIANVETATWAALQQREVAASCTMCHTNQTKCDNCHTRHEFSLVEARKPQACATCHNGVDHNEYENFMMSKHGTVYQTLGHTWDWNARLADAFEVGGQTAPTCQTCHFEYKGEFTHNVVRKVRWGFLPFQSIVDNLDDPWFESRKQAWQSTCSQCHSPRFAKTYLDMMDSGIKEGTALVESTRKVVQKLYDDQLLVGQKTNRPALPEPEVDEPGAFSSLFFAQGNSATIVDRTFAEMWEQHVAQYMKGLEHVNPGGWTYSSGWSDLIKDQIIINEHDTQLRAQAALEERVSKLEGQTAGKKAAFLPSAPGNIQVAGITLDTRYTSGSLAMLGGGLLLGGMVSIRRSSKRKKE
ncbi:multiheme c-type cytochrome [Allopusillimonas ginsengisoli]|uniref:multiheme c-type cytochrome n=1 Tax=Allopusillimonas ginsengisoli TaxID=453575 RepID=UPI0010219D56|nr:multiheme c-type cytochrome [Allopusillimonas ginsengisoli]TEA78989.1 hydroxylamine reductase [Allopusillimonas ginsengisoli]